MTNYPFFVRYIEAGVESSDTWSEKTLTEELVNPEIKILSVELAWSVKVALGLESD